MKRLVSLATCLVFLTAIFLNPVGIAYAANTYSIDLELSSSPYLSVADNAALSITSNVTIGARTRCKYYCGATMTLGYIAASPSNLLTKGELLSTSGTASVVIPLRANEPAVIVVKGTVVVGSTAGDLQLQWAQFTSNSTATTVKTGSYIRADLFE